MIKHIEIKSYLYGDIKVSIKTDYDKKEVSLVRAKNIMNGIPSDWEKMEYVFIGRGVEYRNGWLNVLHGIEYAIKEAFDELEKYLKDIEKEKISNVEAILSEATLIVKNKGKKK